MRVTCVVDNTVRGGSSLWGEHGLAFLIGTEDGHSILFDTGQSGTVLLHNLHELGVQSAQIEALALSHAHRDHTGGLGALLERSTDLPIYAHPDLFQRRFSRHGEEVESIGLPLTREIREALTRAELRLSTESAEIAPGVWTTGEITSRSEPEGRSERHLVREDGGWVPDPYRDDQALVLEVASGLVVICGCCHAGLLNTLAHVRRTFEGEIVAVAGGFHLGEADEAQLEHTITVLKTYGPPQLYPNHCTGERAYVALACALSGRVQPCPAGTVLSF